MKLSCVVLTAVCAMATIAAQVNSAPTATAGCPLYLVRIGRWWLCRKAARKTVTRPYLRLAFGNT